MRALSRFLRRNGATQRSAQARRRGFRFRPSAISPYYDTKEIAREIVEGDHRDIVGGLWEEIGTLQLDFLRANGLDPSSIFLDIGCGCLRGGVHLVDYLLPNCYFGIDISADLLRAGYEVELNNRGLCEKLPRSNLLCDGNFRFDKFRMNFDLAFAHSLFTHMPGNLIKECLVNLAKQMKGGAALFATFFLVPDDHPEGVPFEHPHGFRSFDEKNPYHIRFRQIRRLCEGLPWHPMLIGGWGHPRDQMMVRFEREGGEMGAGTGSQTRDLSVEDAASLSPGADHYRAYVGPPNRYDFMSASQFSLLFALGLRENQTVLDFGCGSLRLGRLLIPYLRPQRYFAIDPNRWLIEAGIDKELGLDIVGRKLPSFSFNDDFRCEVFKTRFDFIVAQSILTHCGPDLAERLLSSMRGVLAEKGKALFSIVESPSPREEPTEEGWTYPAVVAYGEAQMTRLCRKAGLECMRIPWFHPKAAWYMAAASKEDLPRLAELSFLRGAVLFDPQFAESRLPDREEERG